MGYMVMDFQAEQEKSFRLPCVMVLHLRARVLYTYKRHVHLYIYKTVFMMMWLLFCKLCTLDFLLKK